MVVAILQSNYIPWKGYFDIIARSDVFVIYDEVQYTKNDWRNRNIIKTHNGPQWLTIPVRQESLSQKISETVALDRHWAKKHIGALQTNYGKAPFFNEIRDSIFALYDMGMDNLSEINTAFIKTICGLLGITTRIVNSEALHLEGDKVGRLIDACQKLDATTYLSGPAARSYIDEAVFRDNNIAVTWMDYSGYPTYHQLFPPFEHGVTILDLLFNEGPEARKFLKY